MKNSISLYYARNYVHISNGRIEHIKQPRIFCEGDKYTVHPNEVLLFTLEDSIEEATKPKEGEQ